MFRVMTENYVYSISLGDYRKHPFMMKLIWCVNLQKTAIVIISDRRKDIRCLCHTSNFFLFKSVVHHS